MPKNGVKVAKFADTTTAFVVLLRGRVEKVASSPWICGIMYQLNKRKYWIFCISKIGCSCCTDFYKKDIVALFSAVFR